MRPDVRDLNDLRFFAAVVSSGGFSRAARELGLPKSRLSRRVAQLEADLGVRLLERSTRRLQVTEVGREVYAQAATMTLAAEAASEAALRVRAEPQGLVRLSCPLNLHDQIARRLPTFLTNHPRLRLQILSTNRRVDLIEERVDVAVRVRERLDTDADLQMRRIGISRRIVVASPGFVQTHGQPLTAQEEYVVKLCAEERERLEAMIKSGKRSAQLITKARILLKADTSDAGEGWTDGEIAAALDTSVNTVGSARRQLVEEGFEATLVRKYNPNSARPRIFDGATEAKLIALACSPAPEGFARWSLRLLEEKVVELNIVEKASDNTIGRTLKKTLSNRIAIGNG